MRFPFTTKIITGCESDGTLDSPYLARTTLLESRAGNLYLHHFLRSDRKEIHDHPWNFISLIIWPGYLEEHDGQKKLKLPGMLLFRKATWQHRVELLKAPCPRCSHPDPLVDLTLWREKPGCPVCNGTQTVDWQCWTLVWVGQKTRTWGFWTNNVFTPWRDYFRQKGCGG